MSLEAATHITDLVITNPAGTDDRSTADDHIRLLKSVLKTDFATINSPITATPAELNLLSGKTGTIWTSDNDGAASGLDADTVDTYEASALLDRANHTGTQLMSTISDAGALATLNTVGTTQIDDAAVTGTKIASATVAQGNIAASAVGQGQLKTTTGSLTFSNSGHQTLPGGSYGFYPQASGSSGGTTMSAYMMNSYAPGTTSVAIIYVDVTTLAPAYILQRYSQASPPYDLGDGEIPLFIFAVVDNATGSIESTYAAPEAPWHYNGPTDIRAQVYRNGKPYRMRRDMSAVPFTWERAKGDPVKEAEYAAAFAATPLVEEEITQGIKNADMPLISHPFQGNDLTGKTIVMLDPVADLTYQLFTMHSEYDDFDLASLLTEANAFQIDNVPLTRNGPPGVQVVSYKWR